MSDVYSVEECLDWRPDPREGEECKGAVEYRYAMSGTGKSFQRCDKHFGERLVEQERITSAYGHPDSDVGPSWVNQQDDGGPLYSEFGTNDYDDDGYF